MMAKRTRLALTALTAACVVSAAAQTVEKRQIGQMVLEDVPVWDKAMRARMLQYLQLRSASLNGLNDDGSEMLVSTRFGSVSQLHRIAKPMGARQQITFFDEPVGGIIIPGTDGKRLLYAKDTGGNENTQFFIMDLETGRHTMLTDGESRNNSPVISRSGRYIAFSGTARNGRDFDVYTVDLSGDLKPRLTLEVSGNYYCSEFSPDESRLLVMQYVSAKETNWFVLDVRSGQHVQITPATAPTYYGGGAWNRDASAVYLTSDRGGEFRKLYRFDLDYNKWTCLTGDIDWDVSAVAVEPTGKGIAYVTNEDAMSTLYFADEWGNGRKVISSVPPGRIRGIMFAPQGGVLGITHESAASPRDAYTISYPDGVMTRWTESEVGGLNTAKFVTPEIFRYPTFDKTDDGKPRMIPAMYYRAPGPGPHPVVLYVHGGPESQERPRLRGIFQYWLNELGISIIAPNVRGSTGYGRSFHQLDNGVKREDSVRDVGALLDWIDKQPELDSKRIGIFGGSYGGYMVLASLTNYPDRFKAGIDIVGITNFVTFLENTEEYRRDLRRAEYGDERIPEIREVLERVSPLNNAEKIKAALFVLQGANDPRVPRSEAEQIVAKMRELGRPVWYALALNEGHGFRKRENSDMAAIMYALFWQKHLLK